MPSYSYVAGYTCRRRCLQLAGWTATRQPSASGPPLDWLDGRSAVELRELHQNDEASSLLTDFLLANRFVASRHVDTASLEESRHPDVVFHLDESGVSGHSRSGTEEYSSMRNLGTLGDGLGSPMLGGWRKSRELFRNMSTLKSVGPGKQDNTKESQLPIWG